MNIVGDVQQRQDRPAYVRFERRAVEDRSVKSQNGRWPKKDVDFALVTPPYSRDVFEQVATEWFEQRMEDVRNGRLPEEWYERYRQQYEKWKLGEELPLDGEPIKGWGVLSPAQQSNLIALNIRTVEDLAAVNDEGMRRIGMGAGDLRDKARAWLSQMKDKGPLTQENATLRSENVTLKARVEQLETRVRELSERLEIHQSGGLDPVKHFDKPEGGDIEASDIIDSPEPVIGQKLGIGKSRKQPEVSI